MRTALYAWGERGSIGSIVLRDGRVRNEREPAAAVLLHAGLVGLPIITRADPHRPRLDRRDVLGRDDVLVVAVAAEVHGDGAHVDVEAG